MRHLTWIIATWALVARVALSLVPPPPPNKKQSYQSHRHPQHVVGRVPHSSLSTRLFNVLDDMLQGMTSNFNNNNNNNAKTQPQNDERLLSDPSDVVLGLQIALDELETVLDKKRTALAQQQDVWSLEKTGLVAQVAALTASLSLFGNNDPSEASQQEEEQFGQDERQLERERLQREILLLKNQRTQVTQRLEQERQRNDAWQTKVTKANDALEFEQMLFFKDKKSLQERVVQQQSQLKDMQTQLQRDDDQFETTRQEWQASVLQEQDRGQAARQEIQQLQQEYERAQKARKEQVAQQELELVEAQRQLQRERKQVQKETMQLERQLEQEQARIAQLEETIELETANFKSRQPVLEQALLTETQNVEQLQRQFQREQDRFIMEKSSLEERIAAEETRLTLVQAQLGRERTEQAQVKNEFRTEQALIAEQREDDRSRMARRYTALRQVLLERVEQEKRGGRRDQRSLAQQYEDQLSATQASIQKLQGRVQEAVKFNANLQGTIHDTKQQVQKAYTAKQQSDLRYQMMLTDRTKEISTLQGSIQALKVTNQVKEEEVERIEHSYRAIAKSTLQLTGRRLNYLNPLRLIRRGGKKKDGR